MNTKDKTQNSIRNSIFGIASQLIIILISFFTRSIFLRYLSEDYLGLNGLFSIVISILSFCTPRNVEGRKITPYYEIFCTKKDAMRKSSP